MLLNLAGRLCGGGNARYGLCGFGLLIISYALFFFNPVEIIKSAKLKFVEGSYAFQLWQKPPVKVYVNVYIFNVTNADRFLAGEDEKLDVKEVGPYVYWEELENTNTTFQSNDTVTYIPRRKLHFDLNLSVGDPEVDHIVVPNIPLLGFSSMLRSSPMFVNVVFNSLVEYQDSQPILDLSVKEFLWGYDDKLVKMASSVLPTWINFSKFGLLDRMLDEGTNVVTMTVPSERQTRRPYTIDNFNGSPILHQWANTDEPNELNKCSLNASSEGLLFPRHLTKDMNFPIYRKAFCRTLPLTYSSTSDMPIGYPSVYLYKFLPEVFNSSLDDNKCYCPQEGCLPAGLSDISPCYYNIPVAVSFPHFYGGDPALVDNVNGIAPNMEKHQSVVAVQPDLGIPLAVDIKIQLNLIIKATRYVSRAKKFNGLTLPICWLHLEVKSLPSSLNALLYLCFNVGPVLVKAVVALTASVGFFLVGLSIKRFGRGQQKQPHLVNGSAAGDHESGRGRGCEDDDNDDDSGRGDDYEDDGGGAESGGLIVKRGLVAGRYCDKSYLPLHHVTIPGSSSVVVDYDHSQDYARGR
ncbi:scavenger receptor class B member 1-like isoform X1 [Metopolophium dirhodum]|uniref:scavenger receptor class B member 1-like isoform X1 n=1 Tax=Metopolophium dirhodum TaxID=44670 RepID=UPI00298F8536|nr:scavenger receptor class B member 1-like isoform X1 [Metopolophium dirhodum]